MPKTITLSLNDTLHAELKRLADADGLTLATYIERQLAGTAIKAKSRKPEAAMALARPTQQVSVRKRTPKKKA
jgi:hypothetical protein